MTKKASSALPRIITKKELRLIVPYTPQHILRLERRGKFPKRIQIGARRVGWYLVEVETWLSECARGATPEPSWARNRNER
jgi:prophage regulatory protein